MLASVINLRCATPSLLPSPPKPVPCSCPVARQFVLSLMVLHCAEGYGEIFCMLSHRCSFRKIPFYKNNWQLYGVYHPSDRKRMPSAPLQFPSAHLVPLLRIWDTHQRSDLASKCSSMSGFFTVMGRVLVSDRNKRVDRRTIRTASLAYGCSRSKLHSHFFVHPFEQITHQRRQL